MIRQTEVEAAKKAVTVTADEGVDLGGDVQELSVPGSSSGRASLGLKGRFFFAFMTWSFFFFKPKSQLYL